MQFTSYFTFIWLCHLTSCFLRHTLEFFFRRSKIYEEDEKIACISYFFKKIARINLIQLCLIL